MTPEQQKEIKEVASILRLFSTKLREFAGPSNIASMHLDNCSDRLERLLENKGEGS